MIAAVAAAWSAWSGPAPEARAAPERPRAASQGLTQEGSGRLDLDGDGALDCWRLSYEGGTGYGSWTMSVQAPCGSIAIEIQLGGSFGDFVAIAGLPQELVERPRLLGGMLDHWFGKRARKSLADIDGSLGWLIERYTSSTGEPARRGDWYLGVPYTPRWTSGSPALPGFAVVTLLTPAELEVGAKLAERLAIDDKVCAAPFLLAYYAHNHHQLRAGPRRADLAVHVTDHAVAVEDRRKHAWSWVFVTVGQTKLRHPSVVHTATDGTLVAVELTSDAAPGKSVHELVVVDPRSGTSLWRDDVKRWKLDARGLQIDDRALSTTELVKLLQTP